MSTSRRISSKSDDDSMSSDSCAASDNENYALSTCTTDEENENDFSEDQKVKLVARESRHVLMLRICVVFVLVFAAVVCVCVYFITHNGEDESFETNYKATALKVTETFMAIAHEKMGAAGSMVVALVSQGLSQNDPWPFVTLPSFQERAATVMTLSGALYIGFDPVVPDALRSAWEVYSTTSKDAEWYPQGRLYQQHFGFDDLDDRPQILTDDPNLNVSTGVANHIYDYDRNITRKAIVAPYHPAYLPIWQTAPVTKRSMVNQNRASNSEASTQCLGGHNVVFEGMQSSDPGYGDDPNPYTAEIAWLLRLANRQKTLYAGDIYSTVYLPIYNNFSETRATVGIMRIIIHWARYFQNILPDSSTGVVFVLENACDEPYTYQIDGRNVIPLGHGDRHDDKFDQYETRATFEQVTRIEDGTTEGMIMFQGHCPYSIRVYPSQTYYDSLHSNIPLIITCAVAIVFVYTVIIFYIYDRLVERRQNLLMSKATQTHRLVASLFPKNVRDRLLADEKQQRTQHRQRQDSSGLHSNNKRLRTFLEKEEDGGGDNDDATTSLSQMPIADLIPHATVLFADISGFTAWSSSREPAQVFLLLQNIYHAFDQIAKRRKVFKVETVGDSYVAVTGLPEPQPNHAVIMARFAAESMLKMTEVVRNLEKSLGPDTAELLMRVGMNSGSVTAGVLRGEKSRFQLFGDTMNTASRMESTGVPGKIQVSQTTADLLIEAGKGHWVTPREDSVVAKGKGVLKTFWVSPHQKQATRSTRSSDSDPKQNADELIPQESAVDGTGLLRHERMIDWLVDLLHESIRHIVAQRQVSKKPCTCPPVPHREDDHIALDEVVEKVILPEFDGNAVAVDVSSVKISPEITVLLREYIAIIASTYHDNPFHNFSHACHVTMNVNKFLKRIVTQQLEIDPTCKAAAEEEKSMATRLASHLHDYTYGINSDPITWFAIVFSALIHDVDHRGIPNARLMVEEPIMAQMFRNRSVAEQNSLEIAWRVLISDRFKDLRDYIFADEEELFRFRQILVNAVLATDLFDQDLEDMRIVRWVRAFSRTTSLTQERNALKATIVMEYIMQASDVCHTMQHWHIYRKWNEKLFCEVLLAYRKGRATIDPSTYWYAEELNFFDNYVIPIAKKLKECNVFGAASDECLTYALRNRAEWEAQGQEAVEAMVNKFKQ